MLQMLEKCKPPNFKQLAMSHDVEKNGKIVRGQKVNLGEKPA